MSELELVDRIPVANTLGEGILWDERSRSVWWTDIQSALLYRYDAASAKVERFTLPERLCSFGFIEGDDRLVCAFANGFALYAPHGATLEWLQRPEANYTGTRFNDGRVDRQGRFWSGTMVEGEARDASGSPVTGSLYRLSTAGCARVLGGIEISNSLCWSPDGAVLYFADSPTGQIKAYDFDGATGEPGAGRVLASVTGDGVPDGSTVDAEGCLWNAQWGGAKVVRYTPDGEVDYELELPVSQPTCLCFGGEDLDLLFVTTARDGLEPKALRAQPEAGHVLVYATPYRGLAESRFRL